MCRPVFGSTVPVLLVPHASAMQLVMKVGVGATLPAGSVIVHGQCRVPVTVHWSLTVSVTVYVPGAV